MNRTSARLFVLVISTFLLTTAQNMFAAATVGFFTGGDPGEGLDLQGNFVYAFNVGSPGDAGQAGDAYFTADDALGISVTAVNEIASWHAPEYGDTLADDVLEFVMQSIRWSPAPEKPTVVLSRLTPGATYKLQLLFAEQCCANRGFDVVVDGVVVTDEFNPSVLQGGAANTAQGAVVTFEFLAQRQSITIVLDGTTITTPEFSDHNPILGGVTLELVNAPGDADNDGLPDAWEQLHFKDLTQTATGDPDNDGLQNLQEFAATSNPTVADTDGDGLNDRAEVVTHRSDPNKADTDSDGLSDADEVNTHGTNPTLADTDSDGLTDGVEITRSGSNPKAADSDSDTFSDLVEFFSRTNPQNKTHFPRSTILQRFTGGDPGEGLDFQGTFTHALNVGTVGPAGKVGDADFGFDDSPGALVTAVNEIPTWHAPEYGNSANDDALEIVMQSIRWSPAANIDQPSVNVDLDSLVLGQRYKLQLLFAEQCCAGRAFDISVGGKLIADEFNPAALQGGAGNRSAGAVVVYEFVAKETLLSIVLDGRTITTASYNDHNAILNGVTLEHVAAGADSDNDGLPDAWETAEFGNLAQTGTGDADGDGLTNSLEYELFTGANDPDTDDDGLNDGAEINTNKTNPNLADSDGDGLSDGDEVNTHGSDPMLVDTDGDQLSDHAEVVVHKTNPKTKDTDGDGVEDGAESAFGFDPTKAEPATQFTNISAQSFSGGDPGEGLDLQGNFLYAFNVGTPGAAGKAGDADFTADNVPGVKVTAQNQIATWTAPEYGDTSNDLVLNKVMQSIRWSAAPTKPKIELSGLIPSTTYKVQLLFSEQCCAGRGFDVMAEGRMVLDEFNPSTIHGGPANPFEGAVVSFEFVAQRDTLVIILDGTTVSTEEFNDHNPILGGATVEIIKEGTAPVASTIASLQADAAGLRITFSSISGRRYTVEYRENLGTGSWEPAGESITATGATSIFTDGDPARRARPQGYYRIRSL